MNTQMQYVAYYIEEHLDETLDVMQLAKIAGYSHFHFCRIFKLHVGESVRSYMTRLKLERAATEMTYADKSIITIALDAGYQTPTGFLKAFKARFGTTPTTYKSSSKQLLQHYKEIMMTTPKIVTREQVSVVFVRALGNYMSSSEIAWKHLSEKMYALEGLFAKNPPDIDMHLGKGNGEALGICHDDPQVTDEENIRYDAALAWTDAEVNELKKYGFDTKTIAGGTYAMVSYMGNEAVAEQAWYGLYAWIEQSRYTFRDEPSFEKYLNGFEESDPSKIRTEIYVPITL